MSAVRLAQYAVPVDGSTAQKVRQPRDQWGGIEGERTLARTFEIPYLDSSSNWEDFVPVFGTALDSPSMSWMLLDRFELRELDRCAASGTGRATRTLHYLQDEPDPAADPVTLPDDETIQLATTEEISIAAHPNFDTNVVAWGNHSMSDFWVGNEFPVTFRDGPNNGLPFTLADGTALPDELKGLTHYLVGSGQVREVTYSLTEPSGWIASDAGKRSAPPTGYPGTAANWLILSGEISPRQNGAYYAKTLVYQWSAKDWDSDIYDAV